MALTDFFFLDPEVLMVKYVKALFEGKEDDTFSFLTTSWTLDMAESISARVNQALECAALDPLYNKGAQ